jgi:phosphoribosylformylglycinamidine (FGAM) synthase PurS component
MVLKVRHFRKSIRITLEVLKCGAGEDGEEYFDRLCEKLLSNTEIQRLKEYLHTIKRKKANWIGHSLRRNCLLHTLLKLK